MNLLTAITNFLGSFFGRAARPSKTSLLNRTVLVLIPQGPYIKWAAKVSQEPMAEVRKSLLTSNLTAYLLPQNDDLELDEEMLKKMYLPVFERLLGEWCLDKEAWPEDRSYTTFKNWFSFTYCNNMIDLCQLPLEHRTWDEF